MLKFLKYQMQKMNEGNIIINIITWIFIIVLIGIVFYLLYVGSQNICFSYIDSSEKAGQIGDSAGLLNSIFSGLALLGVIITVYLQSKELKQTREELKGQKEQFQIRNKILKNQQFENTFFNMLKTQEKIIDNFEFGPRGSLDYAVGSRAFENLYYRIIREYKNLFYKGNKNLRENIIKLNYSIDFVRRLDPYFQHLYRIIKFIDETDFSFCLDGQYKDKLEEELVVKKMEEEKYEYISILVSTMSIFELSLLFYNCINKENKFRTLIEKYHFLQNIRSEHIISKEFFDFYEKSAYGNKYENIKRELEGRKK